MLYNILVTGANGQLGSEIKEISTNYPQFNFEFTDIDQLDITKKENIIAFFDRKNITHIINCAAYTAVDKAEEQKEKAFLLNAEVPGKLAEVANDYYAHLIHISTDFVFDGKKNDTYNENSETNPLSVYGKSKLKGEELVSKNSLKHTIIRTSWLYSAYGYNFVKSMMKKANENGYLHVVNDQFGSPTYAADLAKVLIKVIENDVTGLFNYSNEGAISWFTFARKIIEYSGIPCDIKAIPTSEYPTLAKRPTTVILDKTKIKEEFDMEIPDWKDSLKICIEKLLA